MEKFKTIDEILEYAINAEQDAVDFYTNLAEKTNNIAVKKVFLQNAEEERGHKLHLEKVKNEGIFSEEFKDGVPDLKIADYIVVKPPSKIDDYADALRLAMHREKGAFKLYTRLSSATNNSSLKKLFTRLAQEEANHKLKFELEYDEFVLREN
ncbi:MAG: ferritin family protein [Flavobacteriales bacterium]|nr:ferritin family protein [Flavobacteriales bacterium]